MTRFLRYFIFMFAFALLLGLNISVYSQAIDVSSVALNYEKQVSQLKHENSLLEENIAKSLNLIDLQNVAQISGLQNNTRATINFSSQTASR